MRFAAKLGEGDYRGAVRLACSEGTLADKSNATYLALQQMHPHNIQTPQFSLYPFNQTILRFWKVRSSVPLFPSLLGAQIGCSLNT